MIVLAPGVQLPRAAARFSFSRSGGPGGQAVNKLSTRAELRVAVGAIQGMPDDAADRLRRLAGRRLTAADEIVIHAETYRSQLDNKQACIERLQAMVKQAMKKPRIRRKTKPSKAAQEKRLAAKRAHAEKKDLRRGRRVRDAE